MRAAIEKALAGGNESARVSAVKLLSDIDAFGKDACPVCARTAAVDMTAVRAKLATLLERELAATVDKEVEERAEQLAQERLAALTAEHQLA